VIDGDRGGAAVVNLLLDFALGKELCISINIAPLAGFGASLPFALPNLFFVHVKHAVCICAVVFFSLFCYHVCW